MFHPLETRLQELRDTLTSVEVPQASGAASAWAQRQHLTDVRMKAFRPILLDAKLSSELLMMLHCTSCHKVSGLCPTGHGVPLCCM